MKILKVLVFSIVTILSFNGVASAESNFARFTNQTVRTYISYLPN